MDTFLLGTFAIGSALGNPYPNKPAISGLTPSEFERQIAAEKYAVDFGGSAAPNATWKGEDMSPNAYDAVWAAALGINQTIAELGIDSIRYVDHRMTEFSQHLMKNVICALMLAR